MVGFQCFLEKPSLVPALAQCAGEGPEPSAEPGVQLVFPGYSMKFMAGLGCSLVSVSGAVLSVQVPATHGHKTMIQRACLLICVENENYYVGQVFTWGLMSSQEG